MRRSGRATIEDVAQREVRNCQIERSIRLSLSKHYTVENKLTDRSLQVLHFGSTHETLDLNCNALLVLLGRQEALSAEVDVQIPAAP